ncbi:spermidine synthase [Edaphovirga cremea]|uniref:spermidine synthase n=1 Tax=Edaphovirga cremea TaxID=2267246 RepID=UPI000DEFE759|nr:spermidine synthase [Edaphovirga cremea]
MSLVDAFKRSEFVHLRGDVIAQVGDDHGDITVIDDKEYRILSFDSIFEQSKMHKGSPALPVHNYIKAMLMVLALTSPQRVLHLGLGGGGLVRSLHAWSEGIVMDVVELRSAVVSVARQYFCLPDSDNIRYLIDDAGAFINKEEHAGVYDLIFSDLYSADAMAEVQAKGNFLAACADRLSADGWLVMNYHSRPGRNSLLSHALFTLFETVMYCTTPSGNVVMYACKSSCDTPLREIQRQARAVGKRFGGDFETLVPRLAFWPRPF